MPYHDYRCLDCGTIQGVDQRIFQEYKFRCPKCGKEMKRVWEIKKNCKGKGVEK